MSVDENKRKAAEAALIWVPTEGIIGLGTGSTVQAFIEGIGKLVQSGRKLLGVATSNQSRQLATRLGIPLLNDDGPWAIDLCVDGADEVNPSLDLIKGGGGAHTREKIVNFSSAKNIIVVDDSKLSPQLGQRWAVPVEVLDFGHAATAQALSIFGKTMLRMSSTGPFRTDSGHKVYDVQTGPILDPSALDQKLRSIPGVVETGLFCQRADMVIVAGSDHIRELRR